MPTINFDIKRCVHCITKLKTKTQLPKSLVTAFLIETI